METVQLNDVVRELSQLLGASLSKSATLVYELDQDLPPVRAEASQLRQIVMNLITNASDALDGRDGTVRLGTSVLRCGDDEFHDTCTGDPVPAGDYVVLEVSDTGMGMESADVARIFDPFYTTKISGRGLGLAAVQGIVRGHHGAVIVDSRLREGTTFRVYLPVAVAAAASPDPSPDVPPAAMNVHPCVLVVDDEPIVLAAIRDVLQLENVLAIIAENGQKGLEMLRHDPQAFSAALVDMTMPGMTGPELLREIRKIRPDLPVALMSGFDQRESVTGLEGAARVSFLEKPFEASALLDLVRRLHAEDRPAGAPGQPANP
jgi:CheY-like chemotaxis protein